MRSLGTYKIRKDKHTSNYHKKQARVGREMGLNLWFPWACICYSTGTNSACHVHLSNSGSRKRGWNCFCKRRLRLQAKGDLQCTLMVVDSCAPCWGLSFLFIAAASFPVALVGWLIGNEVGFRPEKRSHNLHCQNWALALDLFCFPGFLLKKPRA